ncbi:MAG: PhoH family protein [Parolsenella sp.]|uniref:PhoH family protein n=1 Tax=Parolsenella sp. TaxID=2083006 RepID=UPI002A752854|nr:PhoH family protein [Parolsenella sp.]MCI5950631.1 PhoH family protein [Coriobacteriaceae bacterium]MDY3292802.1 PhoH family protein [Parolsenella sp.]
MEPSLVRLTIPDSVDMTALMGPADSLLRRIEAMTDATITVRGNQVSVMGEPVEANRIISIFSQLIQMVSLGETPSPDEVDLLLSRSRTSGETESSFADDILLTYRGRVLRPKTAGQRRYIEAVRRNTLTFALGPAGTGKTYLAMAMAVAALKRREVGRIVLCRPVVEAGESLGYLPGTLQEKLDPYVRPLYDALFDMTDMEKGNALIEQGVIEIAPLAYMRGRTLNDAFVILDEAQNTTPEQMKMFLTRMGFRSKFVVTGDASQRDLNGPSGLTSARRALEGVEDIAFIDLGRADIVRHALVARIVEAYEAAEARSSRIQGGLA